MDRPDPPGGRLRRFLVRLAISFASLIIALLLAEGITRLFWQAPPEREVHNGPQFGRDIDPPIGYELIPGVTTSWFFPGCDYNEERTVVARINEHGLRGRAFAAEKPEEVTRVFCLGDSYTFGTGVQDDETWPVALQALLEAKGESVEVWNCGVPGYDTIQEVAFLEQRLLPFDPDVVIIAYYVNDTVNNAQVGEVRRAKLSALDSWLMKQCREDPEGLAKQVRSVSRLAEILARRTWVGISMAQYSASLRLQYTEDGEGWTAVRDELRRARDLCAERGIGFGVVLYPTPKREGEFLATHQVHQTVLAFCAAEGIECLDLEPVFLPYPVEEMWVGPLNMHTNGALNRVAAEAVGSFLLDGNLLPDSR